MRISLFLIIFEYINVKSLNYNSVQIMQKLSIAKIVAGVQNWGDMLCSNTAIFLNNVL